MSTTGWTFHGAGLAVALATAAVMLGTEPSLSIVWDEGYTLGREARLRLWFRALRDPETFAANWQPPTRELVQQSGPLPPGRDQVNTRAKLLLNPEVLAWFWPFAREEPHGHPPFYALVGLVGDVVTPGRSDLARARLGPILAFSLVAGGLFGFVARRWGVWPGVAASGAWVFQPNLFGHGHYATYDALLSALWVGAILSFVCAVESRPGDGASPNRPRWGWVVVFGLVLGFAADTKLTGWFLPLPFLVWVVLDRNRRGAWTLLVGGVVALATLYLLNPPWWTEPIAGLSRFFASNLNRVETIRIKTLFLGRVVSTPDGSLPWYNTLVWTVFVTPVGFLTLALTGVARALRRARSEPFGLLAVGHWAFLLMLRALPHTPGHDGVRQFLPAFGVLALVAGLGAASVVDRFGQWGKGLVAAAVLEGAVSVALMMPVPLSYYSPIVGGLPGAAKLGMEPTYYWDGLTDEALAWLKAHTGDRQKVRFASFPHSFLYLRDTDRLPAGLLPTDPGTWTWYVVQNRPGSFRAIDRALSERGRPAFVVRKFGVPLLWIFPSEQVDALLGAPSNSNLDSKTPRPTGARSNRAAVGRGSPEWVRSELRALARGLGRGVALRRRVGNRGVDRSFTHDRGRGTDRLLVAETAELLVAATSIVMEEAAMLGSGCADRLANRRRRGRARLGHHAADGRRGASLLVTTGAGVRGHQSAEDAGHGQGQELPFHRTSLQSLKVAKMQKLGLPTSLGKLYALLRG